jgi:hypothetical protein
VPLHLVRHGRPLVDPSQPARAWELDPAGYDEVWALRESGRLPARAAWFTSPEPKALATAALLTDASVGVVDDLAEHRRETADRIEDVEGTVRRAFADPGRPATWCWSGTAPRGPCWSPSSPAPSPTSRAGRRSPCRTCSGSTVPSRPRIPS